MRAQGLASGKPEQVNCAEGDVHISVVVPTEHEPKRTIYENQEALAVMYDTGNLKRTPSHRLLGRTEGDFVSEVCGTEAGTSQVLTKGLSWILYCVFLGNK